MRRLLPAAIACAALLATGCGGSGGGSVAGDEVSLLLDSAPNAVHSGIYLTRERGYDEAVGPRVVIRAPRKSTDAPKLLESGGVDLAILHIHDLALARERRADLVGVMAVVQRPLSAVLSRPGITAPRDLAGKPVGGRRPAPPAGLDHPELVLVATRATLEDRRADVAAIVHALQRGYEEVIADPESAVQAMLAGASGLDRAELAAELDAVAPAFRAGSRDVGRLDRGRLRAWARWEVRSGNLDAAPDVGRAFDFSFAGGSGRG